MYQNILLPVDPAHLDEGHKTLEIALTLMPQESKITLLYVIEEIPNWTDLDLPSNFKQNAIETARKMLESIAADTDRPIQIEVREGHAYSTILKEAEAMDIDMIILSSHKPGL